MSPHAECATCTHAADEHYSAGCTALKGNTAVQCECRAFTPTEGEGNISVESGALTEVERRLREQLNETMIATQGVLAEDRCEVLHKKVYKRDGYACVECTEHAAGLLPDSWDEQVVRAVLEPLDQVTRPGVFGREQS